MRKTRVVVSLGLLAALSACAVDAPRSQDAIDAPVAGASSLASGPTRAAPSSPRYYWNSYDFERDKS